jgi:hypothetical protein
MLTHKRGARADCRRLVRRSSESEGGRRNPPPLCHHAADYASGFNPPNGPVCLVQRKRTIHPRHRAGSGKGRTSMRMILVSAVTFLAVFSFGAATAQVQIRPCVDPPTSTLGKCLKRAGSICDPTTRRWIGGNDTAYTSCIAASGQTTTATDAQGRTVPFKVTGRYSDCIRDGQKMGYSADAAKRYCDGRPGLR